MKTSRKSYFVQTSIHDLEPFHTTNSYDYTPNRYTNMGSCCSNRRHKKANKVKKGPYTQLITKPTETPTPRIMDLIAAMNTNRRLRTFSKLTAEIREDRLTSHSNL
jgi:hypothetical protein